MTTTNREKILLTILVVGAIMLVQETIKHMREDNLLRRELKGSNMERDNFLKLYLNARQLNNHRHVPSEGGVVITPKDKTKKLEDVVDITVHKSGMTRRIGLQTAIAPFGFGVDYKVYFFGRLGLNVGGMHYPSRFTFTPTVSVSYKLDRLKIFQNTEVMVGYQPLPTSRISNWMAGLRINL